MTKEEYFTAVDEEVFAGHLFLRSLTDIPTMLNLIEVLLNANGITEYHASLATVADTKEDFEAHLTAIDESEKIVIQAFADAGFTFGAANVYDSIRFQTGKLALLYPKAVEFGLAE